MPRTGYLTLERQTGILKKILELPVNSEFSFKYLIGKKVKTKTIRVIDEYENRNKTV